MATVKTWAGGTYSLPLNREPKGTWGTEVSNFLIALANNAVSLTGGTQTLAAELNTGATYGLVMPYVKSASANLAAAGMIRLANTDVIGWRNGANSADLALDVNTDRLRFGGAVIPTVSSTDTVTNKSISGSANTLTNIPNSATTAASTNTASAIVTRDGSGNFAAGTITAALAGNATTATTATSATTASNVSGTVAIANGGTGQTTANTALNALLPTQTSNANKVLTTDGTSTSWTAVATTVTTTQGDVIYRGASADTRLAAGVNGQRLRTGGSSANPSWGWNSIGAKSANYTITDTDGFDEVHVTTGASTIAITLPAAANNAGRIITVRKADAGAGKIAISRAGSDTIHGYTTTDIGTGAANRYAYITLISDGTATWYVKAVGGERITNSASSIGLTTATIATPLTIDLSPGNYRVRAYGYLSGAASQTALMLGISTDSTAAGFSDAPSAGSPTTTDMASSPISGSASDWTSTVERYVTITAAATYYMKARSLGAGGTAGFFFEATRL